MVLSATFWLTGLIVLSDLFLLVGVVIYMITPKPGRREYWPLGAMLAIELLRDIMTFACYLVFHIDTNPIISILSPLVFLMIVLLYKKRISTPNSSKLAIALMICYLIFGLINFLFIQGVDSPNTYTWLVENVAVIIISLAYFYILIQQLPTESITRLPMFWINTAMLIFYSGTFVISVAADYLINVVKNDMIFSLGANYFLALVSYAIIWRALFLIRAEYSIGK